MLRVWGVAAGLSVPAPGLAQSSIELAKIPASRGRLVCGVPSFAQTDGGSIAAGSQMDCDLNLTNPLPQYDPSVGLYRVRVVVHIIQNAKGVGYISPEMVHEQVVVLNEDFLALRGTNGEPGTDTQIAFALASVDPDGKPTTGITYSTNDTWFADGGEYWESLAWDPQRYMNVYVNNAGNGTLGGYAVLPASSLGGTLADRVVIYWRVFGRPSDFGPPSDLGRTAVHEAGHYLGLWHTFESGCSPPSEPACYSTGDRICDTNPHQGGPHNCRPHTGCPSLSVPVNNYMNYNDDICQNQFTPQQARRMRCSLINWRPLVYEVVKLCDADIDGSRIVDMDDLLAVIASWGPCPAAGACASDINHSGATDVDDLVAVMLAWGPCPQ